MLSKQLFLKWLIMTVHEINQRSSWVEYQLELMDDIDVHVNVIQYLYNNTKIKKNHKHMI